jgi:hypothetical protein
MDFQEIKERISVVDVCHHYNVQLFTKPESEYANAACPLSTHPPDAERKGKFCVHLPSNRWQCKNAECGKKNRLGERWGDCINLVMVFEQFRLGYRECAQKLEHWFTKENAAPHIEARQDQRRDKSPASPQTSSSSSAVAVKYTETVRAWFDTIWPRQEKESDAEYKHRLLKAVTGELIQNYKKGQAARPL